MPVEAYELAQVRSDLEYLSKRVKAIEDARHEETMARYEKKKKRAERQLLTFFIVLWMIIVAAWSAIITAAIVGD